MQIVKPAWKMNVLAHAKVCVEYQKALTHFLVVVSLNYYKHLRSVLQDVSIYLSLDRKMREGLEKKDLRVSMVGS